MVLARELLWAYKYEIIRSPLMNVNVVDITSDRLLKRFTFGVDGYVLAESENNRCCWSAESWSSPM